MAHSLKTLIIDRRPSDMEVEILNAIKAAGFGVRPQYAETAKKLEKKLDKFQPDLILYRTGYEAISLPDVTSELRQRQWRTPILGVSTSGHQDPTSWMQQGAHDVVNLNEQEHLQMVVRRTIRGHVDYLELQRARSALKAREHLHLNLLESSVDPIAYIHDGMHISANKAYMALFGKDMEELEGLPLMDLVPEYEQQHLKVLLTSYQDSHEFTESARIEILEPEGPKLVRLDISPAEYDGEQCMQLVIHFLSPTQSSLENQLDHLAIYDLGCGLYTRNYLLEQVERHLDRGHADEYCMALVLLDINNFSELESRLGYHISNQLFSEIGARLKQSLELDDLLARVGTSRFGLLLSRSNTTKISALVNALVSCINDDTLNINERPIPCSLAAGVYVADEFASEVSEIIAGAESALDSAREHGLDLMVHQTLNEVKPQRIIDQEWNTRLRDALKEDRLKLVFQPIVYLRAEDSPSHYDIMLRMQENDGALVTPSEFLKSAERTGLAQGLDRWVILNALKAIELHQMSDPRAVFSIKLTEDTVRHEDAVQWISEQLRSHDLDNKRMVFEIKSDLLISHLKEAQRLIDILEPLGCRFTVDDFNGTIGLEHIFRHLNVRFIKLESRYLKTLEQHPRHEEFLSRMVKLAHEHQAEVIMKNVEDSTQFQHLSRFDIDYVQGYFMHPPGEHIDHDLAENFEDETLFDPTAMAEPG